MTVRPYLSIMSLSVLLSLPLVACDDGGDGGGDKNSDGESESESESESDSENEDTESPSDDSEGSESDTDASETDGSESSDDEEVPDPYKGESNPLDVDDESVLDAGEANYDMECAICHASDGTGKLQTAKDMTTEEAAAWADDWMLWKISEGSPGSAMPPFKSKLSRDEIWQVISYVRTFSK